MSFFNNDFQKLKFSIDFNIFENKYDSDQMLNNTVINYQQNVYEYTQTVQSKNSNCPESVEHLIVYRKINLQSY